MEYLNKIELAGKVHNVSKSDDGVVRFDLHTFYAYKGRDGEVKVATQIHHIETKMQEDITEGDFLHLEGRLVYLGQMAVIIAKEIWK